MKNARNLTTEDKALLVNLTNDIYGAFAEIGAGQEVARFFFQAGKASQTIAKTISASIASALFSKQSDPRSKTNNLSDLS